MPIVENTNDAHDHYANILKLIQVAESLGEDHIFLQINHNGTAFLPEPMKSKVLGSYFKELVKMVPDIVVRARIFSISSSISISNPMSRYTSPSLPQFEYLT